jgi:hypothetical protein
MTAQASWSGGQDVGYRGEVEFLTGTHQLKRHAGEIEALAQRCAAPATSRSSWLIASVSRGLEPEVVLIRDPAGFLRAATVLVPSVNAGSGADVVTIAGAGPGSQGHRAALLADDASYARQLGIALRLSVAIDRFGATAELGPIAASSPGLDDFLAGFPELVAFAVDPIPLVRRETGLDQATDYLSDSMRRNLRKATNRLATDGRTFDVGCASSYSDVLASLPVIERLHRERDHERGRRSDLDDPIGRAVWRARLLSLARDGLLEVCTGYIGGEPAANVVGIRERRVYRILEGHFATEWARYAPGRLLEAAVLQRMLDTPSMTELDWMTSTAADSLIAQNDSQPVVVLRTVAPGLQGGRRAAHR